MFQDLRFGCLTAILCMAVLLFLASIVQDFIPGFPVDLTPVPFRSWADEAPEPEIEPPEPED